VSAESTQATIDTFNAIFNRHDADALAEVLTDDTVFEDTSPPPDGRRIEGKAAVVEYWRAWFARNPDSSLSLRRGRDRHAGHLRAIE
jgi:ketosteroid isomerase-like protein